ncbi:MAG: dihydropteroate synthase [Spirochaetaceae bacterium]|jgi:dihydropteroate synthase|nr:dihydropteroate synthase [Spirochaetaceae bacterium]
MAGEFTTKRTLSLADRRITTELPALVMGIVNVTPDSFWEGSRRGEDGLKAALAMAEDGADIIDIGGESTRPGAAYVGAREEIARVVPLVGALRKRCAVAISVDTRKAEVFRAAFEAGADMVNDVSALEDDPALGDFAAQRKTPVALMHKRGEPAIMQTRTAYGDVVAEVDSYLRRRAAWALSRGIRRDRLVLDPGIGFGKGPGENVALIRGCGALGGGEYPVLVGLSRKTLIGDITGRPAGERLPGSLAAAVLAAQYGASILRVHDVKETVDCLKILRSFTV